MKDEELREQVGRIVGTAILKNDKNYTSELMQLIKQDRERYASELLDRLEGSTETYSWVNGDEDDYSSVEGEAVPLSAIAAERAKLNAEGRRHE